MSRAGLLSTEANSPPAAYKERYRSNSLCYTWLTYSIHPPTNSCGWARHEWLFRLRFGQSRVAQLDLAPTLAVFASRSVTSTPPRFARDYSARARLVIFVETHRLRTSDAERDQ
jgi:hypothetical protein